MSRPKAHYSMGIKNHEGGARLKVELIDLPFTGGSPVPFAGQAIIGFAGPRQREETQTSTRAPNSTTPLGGRQK